MKLAPYIQIKHSQAKMNTQEMPFFKELSTSFIENPMTVRPRKFNINQCQMQKVNPLVRSGPIITSQKKDEITMQTNNVNIPEELSHFQNRMFKKTNQNISSAKMVNFISGSQASGSGINKVEDFQSSSDFTKLNMNEKQRGLQALGFIKNEVEYLKEFTKKEVMQKIRQMHRIYSEGNKKSIDLVMLIVRQLQSENKILKDKLALCMKYHAEKPNISGSNAQEMKEENFSKKQGNASQIKTTIIGQNSTPISSVQLGGPSSTLPINSSRASSKQLLMALSNSSIDQSYQHVQSILLAGEHLQVIHEIQNDDDLQSIHQRLYSPSYQNTFSSQSLDSRDLSNIHQQHISCFEQNLLQKGNFQDSQNYKRYLKQDDQEEMKTQDIHIKGTENENQSMIVNKLLKLKKKSNRKTQLNKSHQQKQPTTNLFLQAQINHSFLNSYAFDKSNQQEDNGTSLNLPFAKISLDALQNQNMCSISQALSILKEYNDNVPKQLINQTGEKHSKSQMPKPHTKISSIVAKKSHQNKENIPV